MDKFCSLSFIIVFVISMAGCCTVRLVSPQKAFENEMDDEVGRHIKYEFASPIQAIIMQGDGVYGDIVVTRISDEAISYTEPLGNNGCKVTRIIDDENWEILSWTYASAKGLCEYNNRFSCLTFSG